jgi:hypothetical protein
MRGTALIAQQAGQVMAARNSQDRAPCRRAQPSACR